MLNKVRNNKLTSLTEVNLLSFPCLIGPLMKSVPQAVEKRTMSSKCPCNDKKRKNRGVSIRYLEKNFQENQINSQEKSLNLERVPRPISCLLVHILGIIVILFM